MNGKNEERFVAKQCVVDAKLKLNCELCVLTVVIEMYRKMK